MLIANRFHVERWVSGGSQGDVYRAGMPPRSKPSP